MDAVGRVLRDAGLKAQVVGEAQMCDAVFTDGPVKDYRGFFRGDMDQARRFNQVMLSEGILKSEGKTYISLAHTDADVTKTIAAYEKAAKSLLDGTA